MSKHDLRTRPIHPKRLTTYATRSPRSNCHSALQLEPSRQTNNSAFSIHFIPVLDCIEYRMLVMAIRPSATAGTRPRRRATLLSPDGRDLNAYKAASREG